MACQFSINFPGNASATFVQVQGLMTKNGGTINGDDTAGSFSLPIPVMGNIKGTYTIVNQTVTINITDKPILLSCGTIEAAIKSKL